MKPILIVQHAPHEHPAAVRRALESQGLLTLLIHPYRGEAYPRLGEISGVISLGGPMGANDETVHPWIRQEVLLLRESAERGLPTVGICLGGQMMARALGGRVEKNDRAEVGWFPIELNDLGIEDPIVGAAGANPTVYHWHGDTFHLPPGTVLLGRSQACERQAYKYGERAYGFQFHPEADHQLVLEWLAIEGVDDDIAREQEAHGPETVQCPETQRNQALKGEKGSLKITAAIGSLFRGRPSLAPEELGDSVRERLAHWMTHRTLLRIELEDAQKRPFHLLGRVATVLSLAVGEFVIFEEENTVLWPIRIEDLREIREA